MTACAQRIDARSHRPAGDAFAVQHFQGRAFFNHGGWSAAGGRIALTLGRDTGGIWTMSAVPQTPAEGSPMTERLIVPKDRGAPLRARAAPAVRRSRRGSVLGATPIARRLGFHPVNPVKQTHPYPMR